MRCVVSFVAALIVVAPGAAQELVTLTGYAPELPPSAKWVGSSTPLRMEDLKGKVVIVHFWRTEDEACEANFKVFEKWLATWGPKQLVIVGIHGPDLENNPEFKAIEKEALKYVKVFPTAVDELDQTTKAWKVERLPMTFLVDKRGQLRYGWEGQMSYKRIRGDLFVNAKLEQLLNEKR